MLAYDMSRECMIIEKIIPKGNKIVISQNIRFISFDIKCEDEIIKYLLIYF